MKKAQSVVVETAKMGWRSTLLDPPPIKHAVQILFVDGNQRVKKIFIVNGNPRWGSIGGGIALELAPYWREVFELPEGFVPVSRWKKKP